LIDLHTHSNVSDGTFTPHGLVDYAASKGITRLALTDHDTVDGLGEACRRAALTGLDFIGGVEISAEFKEGSMHILGYFADHETSRISEKLEALKTARKERNPKIIRKLNEKGMAITMEEVAAGSGGNVIGRPVMARILFEKGYVSSIQEAFDLYLAKGSSCYVDKFRYEPGKAIESIHFGEGIPVLAHPFSLGLETGDLKKLVKTLKDQGLNGIECFYRNHTKDQEEILLKIAGELELIPTGGSDFHGANRPAVEIGKGEGGMNVPGYAWEKLHAAVFSKNENGV
jgi:3',5'-nucleoside bisphosphate phosphatase